MNQVNMSDVGLLAVPMGIFGLVVSIVLAVLVFRDAVRHGKRIMGITPVVWFLIVLISSFFGVFGYWLMHYSRLAPAPEKGKTEERKEEPPSPTA
jgi:hypothetical protein